MQLANAQRFVAHVTGNVPEQITLKFDQIAGVVAQCKRCHEAQFADWNHGPHGASYAKIFSPPGKRQLLMDDCLRCHGMFFDGGIEQLKSRRAELANMPSIPCLACHSVHTDGAPHTKQNKGSPVRPSLAFWDRRSGEHVRAADLPIPVVLEGTRKVRMSNDSRQALCYQCHAPQAGMQAGTGDDRTPRGVHEGLSCLACHQKHGQDARASCGTCHPRLSNCGLDVEKMDTTFVNGKSKHNVHTMKCIDCHPGQPDGPKPRVRRVASVN
jgi:hypothetical protein